MRPRTAAERGNENAPPACDLVDRIRFEPRQRITVRRERQATFDAVIRPPSFVRDTRRSVRRVTIGRFRPGCPAPGPDPPGPDPPGPDGGGVAVVVAVQLTIPVSHAGVVPVAWS
jgi:hypothetical protein